MIPGGRRRSHSLPRPGGSGLAPGRGSSWSRMMAGGVARLVAVGPRGGGPFGGAGWAAMRSTSRPRRASKGLLDLARSSGEVSAIVHALPLRGPARPRASIVPSWSGRIDSEVKVGLFNCWPRPPRGTSTGPRGEGRRGAGGRHVDGAGRSRLGAGRPGRLLPRPRRRLRIGQDAGPRVGRRPRPGRRLRSPRPGRGDRREARRRGPGRRRLGRGRLFRRPADQDRGASPRRSTWGLRRSWSWRAASRSSSPGAPGGITATVAAELAGRWRPTLLLLGRNPPPPAAEGLETAGDRVTR